MRIKRGLRPSFVTSVSPSPDAATDIHGEALSRHLTTCDTSADRLFRFWRSVEALDTFAAPRFVTTLVVFAAALALLGTLL